MTHNPLAHSIQSLDALAINRSTEISKLRRFAKGRTLAQRMLAARAKAETDFAAHQARWDAAAKEIGYSTALRAGREAADRVEALLEAVAQTPAMSFVGVAAKLDAALREGEIWVKVSAIAGYLAPEPLARSHRPHPLDLLGTFSHSIAVGEGNNRPLLNINVNIHVQIDVVRAADVVDIFLDQ
ncbi:hypothetical protein [Methylovirgula sp. 4M-Z18]|uniref:hypothetical protein n=1 Tax=Methylovirgula sp. 4M-Z18 TaxID=2293567 RepID=UPI0011C027F0|nr:hypothetical protein [Methylovirgula sp. 4M-Z18]